MLKTTRQSIRGVTMLEVLIAVFVMLVGVVGVMALFPIGVRFSQMSADDVCSAMTAQNALAAVRVQTGLLERLDGYAATTNESGDTLSWLNDTSRGVDGSTGTIVSVSDEFDTSDPNRLTRMGASYNGTDGNTFVVKGGLSTEDDRGLMLMTNGGAKWKLYRLDRATSFTNSRVSSTKNGHTNFPNDGIEKDDEFRVIGARDDSKEWATVPARFFEDDGPGDSYKLGTGAADGYGYLAIINRVSGLNRAYRVTILVYKGYDEELPPEANQPAIGCYATILSADMLR